MLRARTDYEQWAFRGLEREKGFEPLTLCLGIS